MSHYQSIPDFPPPCLCLLDMAASKQASVRGGTPPLGIFKPDQRPSKETESTCGRGIDCLRLPQERSHMVIEELGVAQIIISMHHFSFE